MSSMRTVAQSQPRSRNSQSHSLLPHIPLPRSPNTPSSPTRTRSTGDLLHGLERSRREWPERSTEQIAPDVIPDPRSSSSDAPRSAGEVIHGVEEQHEEPKDEREKQPLVLPSLAARAILLTSSRRPAQWATLDELLDKLLFLAVSGDGMIAIVCLTQSLISNTTRSFVYHALPADLPEVCDSKKNNTSYAETHASTR